MPQLCEKEYLEKINPIECEEEQDNNEESLEKIECEEEQDHNEESLEKIECEEEQSDSKRLVEESLEKTVLSNNEEDVNSRIKCYNVSSLNSSYIKSINNFSYKIYFGKCFIFFGNEIIVEISDFISEFGTLLYKNNYLYFVMNDEYEILVFDLTKGITHIKTLNLYCMKIYTTIYIKNGKITPDIFFSITFDNNVLIYSSNQDHIKKTGFYIFLQINLNNECKVMYMKKIPDIGTIELTQTYENEFVFTINGKRYFTEMNNGFLYYHGKCY